MYDRLVNELKLPEPVPGGQREFRMTLCVSMLYKFFVHAVESLRQDSSSNSFVPSLESRERSARFALLHEHVTAGTLCSSCEVRDYLTIMVVSLTLNSLEY